MKVATFPGNYLANFCPPMRHSSAVPPDLAPIVEELLLLMRTQGRRGDVSPFQSIARTHRVRTESGKQGIPLDTVEGLRRVLRLVLEDLATAEEAASAWHPAGFVGRPDARPAIPLLGLDPQTRNLGLGKREALAARERDVSPRTMREQKHREELIFSRLLPISWVRVFMSPSHWQMLPLIPKANHSKCPDLWEMRHASVRRVMDRSCLIYQPMNYVNSSWIPSEAVTALRNTLRL